MPKATRKIIDLEATAYNMIHFPNGVLKSKYDVEVDDIHETVTVRTKSEKRKAFTLLFQGPEEIRIIIHDYSLSQDFRESFSDFDCKYANLNIPFQVAIHEVNSLFNRMLPIC